VDQSAVLGLTQGPTLPLVSGIPSRILGAVSQRFKRPGRETDLSLLSSSAVKKGGAVYSLAY
jgi:hypothetical protein